MCLRQFCLEELLTLKEKVKRAKATLVYIQSFSSSCLHEKDFSVYILSQTRY